MGKIIRRISIYILLLFALIIIYYAIRIGIGFSRYSWKEMDWNGDGSTSISELIESSDIGKRTIRRKGQLCTEYYSMKDGLPVKVVCKYSNNQTTSYNSP